MRDFENLRETSKDVAGDFERLRESSRNFERLRETSRETSRDFARDFERPRERRRIISSVAVLARPISGCQSTAVSTHCNSSVCGCGWSHHHHPSGCAGEASIGLPVYRRSPHCPTCWALPGVAVGHSWVLCGLCCCYSLHPD